MIKEEIIDTAIEELSGSIKTAIYKVYMMGYHNGRHIYRNKIKDYLVINPSKKDILLKISNNPCLDCPKRVYGIAKECLSPETCIEKQNQLLALDILKHYESICTDS